MTSDYTYRVPKAKLARSAFNPGGCDHLPIPVDHINLQAIDHLAGVITDHPGLDPRGMLDSTHAGPMGGYRGRFTWACG
jgi:hypothetical protein